MGDETHDDDAAAADEARARTRQSAQDAAGDLARMGIDPRSLGLDDPARQAPESLPRPADGAQDQGHAGSGAASAEQPPQQPPARIVPLRPEFAEDRQTVPPPSPPPPARPPDQTSGRPVTPLATSPTAGHYGPVEQLLSRTTGHRPVPRNPSRLLRAVTLGLLTPDAAEASGDERELVAAIRQRQTERRIVSFVAGKGGVGTTTVACGVAAALAALREDHTVLADAQPGTTSLARLHGLSEPLTVRGMLRSGAESGPARTAGGLAVVDGVGWEQSLTRRDVVNLVDRLGADNTFTLLDVGDEPGEAAHAALARCDQAVVVTTIGEVGLRSLEMSTARLRQVNPLAAERAVFAVVCQHHAAYRRAHRDLVEHLRVEPARVVVVPPDASLQAGQAFDPAGVGPATREAMLEVGAAVALSGAGR